MDSHWEDCLKTKDCDVHWHDNHRTKDGHLPIGEGLIDHKMAVRALKGINYDRTITLEVFTNSNDAKTSTDKLKIMWAKESRMMSMRPSEKDC